MRRSVARPVEFALAAADALVVSYCALSGRVHLGASFALGVAFASLALVSLRLPKGDTLHGGVGICVAGVLTLGGCTTTVAVAGGGLVALVILRGASKGRGVALDILRQPLLVMAFAYAWRTVLALAPWSAQSPVAMGGYMAFAAAYVLVDLVSFAALSAVITGQGLLPAILSFLRFVVGIYLGLASVGVVLALTLQPRSLVSALLSGAILVALMLIMKHNFGLFLQVKSAYGRTVGVLARLAEFEREEARGHSERVADIATGVGRQLRIPNRDLERLNLAALLHAIGRVGSVQARPGRMAGHARLGARMASSIDFLAPIAEIIERHHCKPDEAQSSAEGRLAHIVGVACKFDQLVAGPTERIDEGLAWEYMRSRPAEFASDVIEALRLYRGL